MVTLEINETELRSLIERIGMNAIVGRVSSYGIDKKSLVESIERMWELAKKLPEKS